ncbi:MAG: hypothetical protein K9I34_01150 [Bacteroidales bacterium]|nr:hypothetical protein [Bacteroidales bacterium]
MKRIEYQSIIMKSISFLMISILVLGFSCSSSHKEEISRIDQLLLKQDSLLTQLKSLDFETLELNLNESSETFAKLKKIEPNLQDATAYLRNLTAMGDVQKAFKRGIPACKTLIHQFEESQVQLTNLRHDLKHDLIADSLIESYIQSETEIMKQLSFNAEKTLENLKFQEGLYHSVSNQVDSIINSLSL